MITFRAFIITLLCFIVAVGTRCSCCKCDEVDLKYTSTFKELELTSLDNSGKDTVPVINNTVNKNAYALKLTLISEAGMIANKPCRPFSLFITDANAMSCGCNTSQKYIPTDSVGAVSIISLEPFDDTTPANADVTDRFRYYDRYQGSYIKVNDLINSDRQGLFYPGYYYKQDDAMPVTRLKSAITIMLMEPPAISGAHRFKMVILLKSGLRMEQTTSALTLQ
ncbi:DUF5034 domain-containing protein [Niabella aquatica]